MDSASHLYDLIKHTAERLPGKVSFRKRVGSEFIGFTFKEALHAIDRTTAGLLRIGLKKGDRVLLLCDPTPLWIVVDCAIITAGGVSVPRGTDTTDEEILHIADHSNSPLCHRAESQGGGTDPRFKC